MNDPRYLQVKVLLEKKQLKSFSEIFIYVPYTVVAKDIHTNTNRMKRLTKDAGDFTVQELYDLAKLIGCDGKKLSLFAAKSHIQNINKKSRS